MRRNSSGWYAPRLSQSCAADHGSDPPRCGCRIAGWVANILDPEMPRLQENIDTLKQSINEPCLGTVPRLDDLSPEQVATFLTVPGH